MGLGKITSILRIKKSRRRKPPALFCLLAQDGNVASLRTLRSFFNSEFDLLAFLQVAVAITLNSGEVDEHVRSTFTSDEAVALITVEPLHSSNNSVRHFCLLWQLRFIPLRAFYRSICLFHRRTKQNDPQ